MSEEDLELLITLDDPEGAPEEDTFHHPAAENNVGYWLELMINLQRGPQTAPSDHRHR